MEDTKTTKVSLLFWQYRQVFNKHKLLTFKIDIVLYRSHSCVKRIKTQNKQNGIDNIGARFPDLDFLKYQLGKMCVTATCHKLHVIVQYYQNCMSNVERLNIWFNVLITT